MQSRDFWEVRNMLNNKTSIVGLLIGFFYRNILSATQQNKDFTIIT